MNTIPNQAQLRAMARPAPTPAPCMPGRHCERYARGMGACVAGHCNPPSRPFGPEPQDYDYSAAPWACDPRFAAAHYLDGRDVVAVQCDSHAPPVGVPYGVEGRKS